MTISGLLILVIFLFYSLILADPNLGAGTIIFTTVGRSLYGFDIFAAPVDFCYSVEGELRLTDGVSVNYNGFFPSCPSSVLSLLHPNPSAFGDDPFDVLVYVTERSGYSTIYADLLSSISDASNRRKVVENPTRLQFPLLPPPSTTAGGRTSVSMKDRPSLFGDRVIFVSTREPSQLPRQSWAAVYSTHIPTGATIRLTPPGVADFSPAVSPSGRWTAVASFGRRGWSGEVQELNTDIVVFKTEDGSARNFVVEHGGWPCWADEVTIYFHRRSSDGWWSVYRATLTGQGADPLSLVSINRITPPGFHAFTQATATAAPKLIAVATRRPTSQFRHIEVIHLNKGGGNAYVEVTRLIAPHAHHFNPFFSPDGRRIGYNRCRGGRSGGDPPLLLENIESLSPETFSVFRIDGSFPSFSPDGRWIAYAGLPGIYVVNSNDSNPREVYSGNAFPTAWDWKRKGVMYTSQGA
ncbi:hypothetical protein HPP92_024890 [Vanilla planifolia]|uniref:Uncharacterized protein n=1 Tax=Vanilla planifolia TaxID=51239 RepID=A0A835PJX3_VANPL|nr:hypothetical protein HPP92_024890 [Vanilla planifolia]